MIMGRIARVLSDTMVILNLGSEDEVKSGMEFVIFSEGDHITDPETGEDLGTLEIVKGRVKVTHVMPAMSLANTLTYQAAVNTPTALYLRTIGRLGESYTETRQHRLTVAEDEMEPLDKELTGVKVGDRVRSL